MSPSLLLSSLFVYILSLSNSFAYSAPLSNGNATERALDSFLVLQQWYNSTGLWNTAGWWNGANIVTTIGNLAKADHENVQLQDFAKFLFAKTAKFAPSKNPVPGAEAAMRLGLNPDVQSSNYSKSIDPVTFQVHTSYPPNWFASGNVPLNTTGANETAPTALDPEDWLDGYYDDDLWWALAWINAFDVTFHEPYLKLAEGIFKAVTSVWPTRCYNGGIYWNMDKDYVNAIPNELFMSTAAHLANRVSEEKKDYYIQWAQWSLDWFSITGMVNDDGNINDGLDDDCENNNKTVWSYNQGVILGALVELDKAYPEYQYLPLAQYIADAALRNLSDSSGIIHDPCEKTGCGVDGSQFKGIFMRNLVELYKATSDTHYGDVIKTNANSIWMNDRSKDGVLGLNWAGPFVGPGDASSHSSALDTLVAAISVGG